MDTFNQNLISILTQQDLIQLKSEEHRLEELTDQIRIYKSGIPNISLNRAAKTGDGIKVFSDEETDQFVIEYYEQIKYKSVIKYVPASGAASRMFKDLLQFYQSKTSYSFEELKQMSKTDKSLKTVFSFISNLTDFAFYDELAELVGRDGETTEALIKKNQLKKLISYVIAEQGLNLSNLPKGEIKFHRYNQVGRTAFEEQLVESINYIDNGSGEIKLHFTVPQESLLRLKSFFDVLSASYKRKGINFLITLSFQNKSTDTLAVDLNNNPFRDSNGKLLFRPAGHGALLQNLNDIDEDIIFIKNIDNISPEYLHPQNVKYKKLLGGILIEVQNQIFNYINKIVSDNVIGNELHEVENFSAETLSFTFPPEYNQLDVNSKAKYLFNKLNRPLRVCGMVVNEGHPGGGPFWIEEKDGTQSLQIIESAQIDLNNEKQRLIFNSSTHFNPVDIVCSIKDFQGNKFDLHKFINPSTSLIAMKSKDGRELKSLELPGLWNGSMHYWNTIFVEVPKITFNPVKEVNDLLKAEHQPEVL